MSFEKCIHPCQTILMKIQRFLYTISFVPLSLVPSFPQAILLISVISDSFFLFLSFMEEELDIHALLYLTSLTQQSVILKSIHVVVFVGSSFRYPAEK